MHSPSTQRNHGPNRPLTIFLVILLTVSPSLIAQSQPPAAAPAGQVQNLKVVPLTGNNEMNDLQRKVMAPLVVQVLDQDSRPVEGADVTFRFPVTGPSAVFANQQNAQTVRSNADGQASATGWNANGTVGRFQIQVTAARGNELGTAVIAMTNVTRISTETVQKRKSMWSSKWTKIGIIAAAAGIATAIILANRGGEASSGSNTTTITGVPGLPTIGGVQ